MTTNIFLRSQIRATLKNANSPTFSLIRMRVRVLGERLTIFLPAECRVKPCHWDAEEGKTITNPKRNTDIKGDPSLLLTLLNINAEIDRYADAFVLAYEGLKQSGEPLTVERVKQLMRRELGQEKELSEPQPETFLEQDKPTFTDLVEFMTWYIEQCYNGAILNSKGLALSPGTINNYKSARAAIKRYNEARRRKLGLHTFSMADYHDLLKYMNESSHKRASGYCLNVVGKHLKDLRHILRYAHEHGHTTNDTYKNRDFKAFQTTVQTVYLNETELDALRKLELPSNQATVRDCFLISAYTGLRYSDISRLEEKHINFGANVINIVTQKTTKPVVIPIHPVVREILERNGNKPPCAQSNQATNRMLKVLCEKAGINEPITVVEIRGGKHVEVTRPKYEMISSHCGRRSFCTNAFLGDVPTISVMQMSGHNTESHFMRYIRVTSEQNAATLQNHKFFNGNKNQ